MANYSSYKLAQANGNFTAAIWNGFFSALQGDIDQLVQHPTVVRAEAVFSSENVTGATTHQDGQKLEASEWNTVIGNLGYIFGDLKDVMATGDVAVGEKMTVIDTLGSKQAGNSISNTNWNTLVQNAEDCINSIKSDFDAQQADYAAWKFGNAMPIVLS